MGLLALNGKKVSELSKSVAVQRSKIHANVEAAIKKESRSIARQDVLAFSLSKWATPEPPEAKELNDGQKKAMDLALSKPFQLIQGPPGMCMITKLAVQFYVLFLIQYTHNIMLTGHTFFH